MNLYDADGKYQIDYLQGQPNPLQELLENHGNVRPDKGIGIDLSRGSIVPWVVRSKSKTLVGR
jgi:hypothetical protein